MPRALAAAGVPAGSGDQLDADGGTAFDAAWAAGAALTPEAVGADALAATAFQAAPPSPSPMLHGAL